MTGLPGRHRLSWALKHEEESSLMRSRNCSQEDGVKTQVSPLPSTQDQDQCRQLPAGSGRGHLHLHACPSPTPAPAAPVGQSHGGHPHRRGQAPPAQHPRHRGALEMPGVTWGRRGFTRPAPRERGSCPVLHFMCPGHQARGLGSERGTRECTKGKMQEREGDQEKTLCS